MAVTRVLVGRQAAVLAAVVGRGQSRTDRTALMLAVAWARLAAARTLKRGLVIVRELAAEQGPNSTL